jgi:catechol 2,3-dioxygenase-like lactoylglutathione lyase family enzyme
MSTNVTGIRELSLVCVPVTDQDRSLEFYEGVLGLEKRVDTEFAGGRMRWVEVYAPVGSTGIALAPPPPGSEFNPQFTGITLTTDEIDATHAELSSRGVDLDEVQRMGDPVPPMFFLRDPDGNGLLIVESAAS